MDMDTAEVAACKDSTMTPGLFWATYNQIYVIAALAVLEGRMS